MQRSLMAVLLALAGVCASAAQSPAVDIRDVVVWSVNEYIQSEEGVELAGRVPSQLLVRAWFKWGNARSFAQDAPLAAKVHARGQLFGGGVTMSAVYRGENGIDEATFLDYVTRDPNGKLYPAFGRADYYHGTLSNPAYIDYCLKWAFQQIDAGVDHLFMDEVNAAHGDSEGYDDHAMAAFRRWLLEQHPNWSPTDPQWEKQYRVPLGDKKVCTDGSMTSFHYRAYLQHHGLTENPWTEKNALLEMWFRFKTERDDRAWKEVCERIREYARRKDRRVWIAANGLNRYVDHQIQNMWEDHLCLDGKKRVNARRSLFRWAEGLVAQSRALLGQDVPIVVFHDWGFGMPWQTIRVEDRNLWLRVYAPEIYAAGAFPAFPVHGPFGCDSQKDGTLPTIIGMARFFREHADYFRIDERVALDSAAVAVSAPDVTASLVEQPKAKRRLVHLVNHNFGDGRMRKVEDFVVRVPSPSAPKKVTLVSPDFEGERQVTCENKDGQLRARVPLLEYYDLLVIAYDEMLPSAARRADRDVAIAPRPIWGRLPISRFVVEKTGTVRDILWVNAYLQGKLHADLRNPATFVVSYAQDGTFEVIVNSVARLGAILEIHIDGKMVLHEVLADVDGDNGGFVGEIDRVLSVAVPRGDHEIQVGNSGGDWLTVDRYVFRNALGR